MKSSSRSFLEALLAAPSPSGYEGPARAVWIDHVQDAADEIEVDVHGNAMATINPKGQPHVMLAGHIDEIGFQVCHIEESGFLRFRAIGGHDLRVLPARRMQIHTDSGPIDAVIGKRPIHLMHDRNKPAGPPRISSMWLDAGFRSKQEATEIVQIGDPITHAETFSMLRGSLAVGRALDDKLGAFVVAEVLRELKKAKRLAARVTAVATVQEEVGLRGAHTSTFGLAPDVGIAVDVTWSTDNPGGEAKEIGEVTLGSGPVIVRGPNANPKLFEALKKGAQRAKLALQIRALPRPSGNDSNAMQISRAGLAAGVVGLPLRYMHTPVEVCDLDDIEAAIKLLVTTIRSFKRNESFVPL
jgi:putative aminopeptidase FrvX